MEKVPKRVPNSRCLKELTLWKPSGFLHSEFSVMRPVSYTVHDEEKKLFVRAYA